MYTIYSTSRLINLTRDVQVAGERQFSMSLLFASVLVCLNYVACAPALAAAIFQASGNNKNPSVGERRAIIITAGLRRERKARARD
jgi:hypothetical protein